MARLYIFSSILSLSVVALVSTPQLSADELPQLEAHHSSIVSITPFALAPEIVTPVDTCGG